MEAKIVIGANYGDEGKGFCVSQLTQQAKLENKRVVNILFNGGPQRGHTVDYVMAPRHVYHHFGSGTLDGADTYFASAFYVNPLVFVQEYQQLGLHYGQVRIMVDPFCRVTTPWDMMANQMRELGRSSESKHGTCGYGVWETVSRYRDTRCVALNYKSLIEKSDAELRRYFATIRDVYYGELSITAEYKTGWYSVNTIDHFIQDLRFMQATTTMTTFPTLAYDTYIYEAGQGLGLDYDVDPIYATASKTGCSVAIKEFIGYTSCPLNKVEVIYVTRNYLTRHGEGPLPREQATVLWDSRDESNLDNPWQGHLRIGVLSIEDMLTRINNDASKFKAVNKSLFVTHLNEPGLLLEDFQDVANEFHHIYHSKSKYFSTILAEAESNPKEKVVCYDNIITW